MPSLNTGNAILSNPIKVETTAYNVGIGGAASSSFKLQVTGTTNLTGALSGTSATFSGNVGVGVSSITNPVGFTRVLNIGGLDAALVLSNTDGTAKNWTLGALANGSLGLFDASAQRLSIDSTGAATFSSSVNIGTTASTIFGTLNVIQQSVSAPSFVRGIELVHPNGTGATGGYMGMSMTGQKQATIQVGDDNGAGNLLLQSQGGNVGIGTNSPQGALEVVGLSYFTRSSQSTLFNPNYGGANTHAQLQVIGNMALAFATNGDNERMRITSGGNVLIGTTGAFDTGVTLTNGGRIGATTLGDNTIQCWNKATSGNNLFLEFYTEGGGGALRGSIDYNRAAGLVRYNTTSDANLKNIIGDADKQKSIDILKSTKIREYSWKDDKSNKSQIGVIAQELYETYKGAVSKGSDDELFGTEDYKTWGVDKTAFTFHLIAGWQKHEQIINDLQAQIEELKALINK
jgi:hypothetical protein